MCFRRKVLEKHLSDGLDDMGDVKWSLVLCVFSVFLLVYFSLWKGVRSSGKVTDNPASSCPPSKIAHCPFLLFPLAGCHSHSMEWVHLLEFSVNKTCLPADILIN